VGSGNRIAWIIHRQHPGETMAEYYAEGLLTRILGLDTKSQSNDVVSKVLTLYTLYIVPCMCLDGSVLGHLRTNSVGANLNREWCDTTMTTSNGDTVEYTAPSKERSPEVQVVWDKMQETGVDLFLDVHGDEDLPFCFLSGAEKTQNWGQRLQALHGAFLAAYERSNSDMQKEYGYAPPKDVSGALPNIATNAVANRFDCFASTLEMPFKDCRTNPDPDRGWSPQRSRQLGASVLEALVYIHPYLRDSTEFWTTLPAEDAYVTPTSQYETR
jgi:murein tripeptide amidase MpaA